MNVYTRTQAAALLGCHPSTVTRRADRGELTRIETSFGVTLYALRPVENPELRVIVREAAQHAEPRQVMSRTRDCGKVTRGAANRLEEAITPSLPGTCPDLASELGLPRSTVARVLERLHRHGLARPEGVRKTRGRPAVIWTPAGRDAL